MGLRANGFVCRRMAASLAAGFFLWWLAAWAESAVRAAADADRADGEDVLAEVLRQNSAEYPEPPAPPSRPNSGIVSRAEEVTLRTETTSGGALRVHLADGQAISSPAAAEGNVFVGGGFSNTIFYCLSAETGKSKWGVHLSDNGPSAPSYYQGTVIFTTESCTCYALDSASGEMLWSIWLGDPVISTPTVAGGSVLVAYPAQVPLVTNSPAKRSYAAAKRLAKQPITSLPSAQKKLAKREPLKQPTGYVLAARDLHTGKPQWQKWIDGHVISAPVVRGEDVYVATFGGTFYKLRLSDGEILLARRCQATSAPVVLDDGIYLTRRADRGRGGAPQESVIRLAPETGRQLYAMQTRPAPYLADSETRRTQTWASVTERTTTASREPMPGDPDYVSGGAPPDTRVPSVRLVGRQSPQELQAFCGSRLVAFGNGLFNCMGDGLLAVDPASGEKRWSLPLHWANQDKQGEANEPLTAPPAVAAGKMFVATRDGQLLRVDPRGGRITGRIPLGAPATSQPIIEGGRIFVGTSNGDLVCVETNDPKLTGWNQWGGNAARSNIDDAEMKTTGEADGLRKPSAVRSYGDNSRLGRSGPTPFRPWGLD
jgi:Ca-activated chloride channel family protein